MRLDKIWLHRAVKFDFTADPAGTGNRSLLVVLGSVQIFPLVVGWVGFGQSADGLGWIGSHKMDPWTTQRCRPYVAQRHLEPTAPRMY